MRFYKILIGGLCLTMFQSTVSAKDFQHYAYINHYSIQSFNYSGKPIISVKDLENFGFTIDRTQGKEQMRLYKDRPQLAEFSIPRKDVEINKLQSVDLIQTPNGSIQGMEIDNEEYIYFADLAQFGTVNGNSAELSEIVVFNQEEEYIKGESKVSLETAKKWAMSKNAHQRFIDIADTYWAYGAITGVRPEVLYAQAAYETGLGTYKGRVKPEQNNWAGIKTANATGVTSADFETFLTPEDGVRGHFNHIIAYVGGNPIGDPHGRYYVVKSLGKTGTISIVQDLTGNWCPSSNYSDTIYKFLREMENFK